MAPSGPPLAHVGDNSRGANTVYNGSQRIDGSAYFNSQVTTISPKDQESISDFWTVEYEAEMKKVDDASDRTCQWLEDCSKFKEWSATDRNLLCLVANPGTGKSVVAKSLLKTLSRQSQSRVIHFFCSPEGTDTTDDGKQPTAASVLRNLIHQCLSLALSSNAMSAYEPYVHDAKKRYGQGLLASPTHLTKLFADLISVSDPEACQWYCIIDAFDCIREGEKLFHCLTRDLKAYLGHHAHMRIKIFITSRPTSQVTSTIKPWKAANIVCLANDDGILLNKADFDSYVDSKLAMMGDFPQKQNLRQRLIKDAAGNFKWASSMIKALQQNDISNWDKTLRATSLEDAVSMLETLAENLDQQSQCLLGVIINAPRPLLVTELAAAINNEEGFFARLAFIGSNDATIRENLRLRESAVRVFKDEIRLFHPKMEEVMVTRWNRLNEHQIPDFHLQLGEACLTYLTTALPGHPLLGSTRREDCAEEYHGLVRTFPFLEYASHAWSHHLSQVAPRNLPMVWNHIKRTLDNDEIRELAFQIRQFALGDDFVPGQSLLHILVHHNLTSLTEQVLSRDLPFAQLNVNARDEKGRTPLWVAVAKGHLELVRRLLDTTDVQCNISDHDEGLSPAMLAVKRGNFSIAELFITAGPARVSWTIEDAEGRRPLWIAVARKDDDNMVRLLWRNKYIRDNIETKSQGQPVMVVAARKGHTKVFQFLLEKRASVNAQDDKHGRTPISWASGNGHEAIVDSLLGREDVDLNNRDLTLNQTPFQWAAAQRDSTMARKIFQKLQRLRSTTWPDEQSHMLLEAAERGQVGVFQILLEQNEIRLKSRLEAFFRAAERGHIVIVDMLLISKQVDVNSRDLLGRTILMCAAKEGRTETVVHLLERPDIEIDAVDSKGRKADEWARFSGYFNISSLLEAKRSARGQSRSQGGSEAGMAAGEHVNDE